MKQIVSILLAFTFSQNIIAQTKIITELFNDYYILKQGNKFGLSKDTINVTYKYDSIYASKFEDYIFVKNKGFWGVLNDKMHQIIPCMYNRIEIACCYEEVKDGKNNFIVKLNTKFGLINYKNKVVIPIIYDAITSWIEGGPNAHYVLKDNKIGLIKHGGKLMIPVVYDSLYHDSDDIIKAKKNGKYGVINSKNKIKIPFEYDALIIDFSNYLTDEGHIDKFVVKRNEKWYYLNDKNEIIRTEIPAEEINKLYKDFEFNNYDFKYVGMCFIKQ